MFENPINVASTLSIYSDNKLLATIQSGTKQYVLICEPSKTYIIDGLTEGDPLYTGIGVVGWTTNNVDIVSSTPSSYYGYYDSIQIKVTANNATLNLNYSYGKN